MLLMPSRGIWGELHVSRPQPWPGPPHCPMATIATTIPVWLRNEATGRYLGAAADRSCNTAEHAGDALIWEMEQREEGCWALRSAAVGGLALEGAEFDAAAAGMLLDVEATLAAEYEEAAAELARVSDQVGMHACMHPQPQIRPS